MWNRIRDWAARLYPISLLIGVVLTHCEITDRANGIRFVTRDNDHFLEKIRNGDRELTIKRYEHLSEQLEAAVRLIGSTSTLVLWLLLAGCAGYLLFSRESFRFRVAGFGAILLSMIASSMFYPLH